MRRSDAYRFTGLVLAGVLILSGTSCGLIPEERVPQQAPVREAYVPPEFKTEEVKRGDLILDETISFAWRPAQEAELYFPLGGLKIEGIYVKAGDAVEEGQLLASLEGGAEATRVEELQAAVARAEEALAELAAAQAEALAVEAIWQDGFGANAEAKAAALAALEAEQAEAYRIEDTQTEILRLELADAEQRLRTRRIHAPFAGVITSVTRSKPGDVVSQTTKMITMSDNSNSLFVADTEFSDRFQRGSELTLYGQDDIGYPVEIVDPADFGIEEAPDAVYAKLLIDDVLLKANTRASMKLVLEESLNTLYITKKAIFTAGGKPMVYLENDEGIRTAQEIRTGLEAGARVEVTGGLEEGQVIILD